MKRVKPLENYYFYGVGFITVAAHSSFNPVNESCNDRCAFWR